MAGEQRDSWKTASEMQGTVRRSFTAADGKHQFTGWLSGLLDEAKTHIHTHTHTHARERFGGFISIYVLLLREEESAKRPTGQKQLPVFPHAHCSSFSSFPPLQLSDDGSVPQRRSGAAGRWRGA